MTEIKKIPAASKYQGEIAENYDEIRELKTNTSRDQEIIENILNQFKEGSFIGDIPAGTGRFLLPTISRNMNYLGLDISEDMLSVARQKYSNFKNSNNKITTKCNLIQGSAEKINIDDESLDWLLSVKFIKHLPNQEIVEKVLSEFHRVVRIGAIVQVKISNSNNNKASFFQRLASQIKINNNLSNRITSCRK